MFRAASLFICLVVLCATRTASAGQVWSTAQGNAAHTGYVPSSYSTADFQVAWTQNYAATTGNFRLQPLAAGDGRVFLANVSNVAPGETIRALQARTGVELWSRSFDESYTTISGPAYANGIVYTSLNRSGTDTIIPAFYGISAATGAVLFTNPTSTQGAEFGPPAVFNNVVYQENGYYGGMRAYDSQTGVTKWNIELPQQHYWSPAVDDQHVYLYMGFGSGSPGPDPGRLYALNLATGAKDFEIIDPSSTTGLLGNVGRPTLGPMHDAFVVNIAGSTSQLIRFNLDTRAIAWKVTGSFREELALAHGQLFIINSNTLQVRDELTGNLLWTWVPPATNTLLSNVIVTNTHIFVSGNKATFAIDLVSHNLVWSTPKVGRLALADDMLYVESTSTVAGVQALMGIYLSVPEPSSLALAAFGVAGLASWGWRRRSR